MKMGLTKGEAKLHYSYVAGADNKRYKKAATKAE